MSAPKAVCYCAVKHPDYAPCSTSNDKVPCGWCGTPAERHHDYLGHVWIEPPL